MERVLGHVLLTTSGTAGDVVPFLRLGVALKARGHAVTLASHGYYARESSQKELDFIALDDAAAFERFIEDGHLLNSTAGVPKFLQQHILPQALQQCRLIERACTPETVVVSLASPGIVGRLVAEKCRLPYVSVLMAPSYVETLRFVEALLAAFGAQINEIRTSFGLEPVTQWASWWQAVDRYLGLWPEWFGPCGPTPFAGPCAPAGRPLPAPVTFAGFLWQEERADADIRPADADVPGEIEAFLAGKPAPVLITGGTGNFGGDEFFRVSTQACRQLDRPAILVARLPQILPADLPANLRWFRRVPSLGALAARSAVVIHHGGMGILSQALEAGVPQVVLAAGGDRPDNAARVQQLGVGAFLSRPRWQAEKVREALQRMSTSASVAQRCHEIAAHLQNADPAQAACECIEAAMQSPRAGEHTPARGEKLPSPQAAKVEGLRQSLKQLTPQQQAFLMARLRRKDDKPLEEKQ
ncbi:MAG: glycosyltransferase [Chloroflexota bacterium]